MLRRPAHRHHFRQDSGRHVQRHFGALQLRGQEFADEVANYKQDPAGYPVCVDNDPPQFVNCPTSAVRVKRTAIEPVDFVVPEMRSEGFRPPLTVFQNTICQINITVVDQEPPALQYPQSFVIELVDPQESYQVLFNETRLRVIVSDASGARPVKRPRSASGEALQDVSVSFVPESAFIRAGSFENVTVGATDPSGNQQRCYFQVLVQPTQCDWERKALANQSSTVYRPATDRPEAEGSCVGVLRHLQPGIPVHGRRAGQDVPLRRQTALDAQSRRAGL